LSLQDMGIETIMINCNPETVNTDYETSDRLNFEFLTHVDILNIIDREKVDDVMAAILNAISHRALKSRMEAGR
jgi:carbamoyl-phosphate synthase large subunit